MHDSDIEDTMPERLRRAIATWPGIQRRAAYLRQHPASAKPGQVDVAWRNRDDSPTPDDIDHSLHG